MRSRLHRLVGVRKIVLLLGKDLRLLVRSPALLATLILYPLLVAVVVGLVVRYVGEKPRLALVDEDGLPSVLVVGGERFDVQRLFRDAAQDVDLVPLSAAEADRQLDSGKVLGVLVIPEGFSRGVRSMVNSPRLLLRTTPSGLATRTIDKAKAFVYTINQDLQRAYIETNIGYVRLLLEGGSGTILGNDFTLIGLAEAGRRLERLTASSDPAVAQEAAELLDFLRQTTVAIQGVDDFLRATANPIELVTEQESGRTPLLSEQVQAYALAFTLAFIGLLLASAGIAAERDENVMARLARGLVRLSGLVAEKVILVAVVAGGIGFALALAFGITVEIGDVAGGQPWSRLPLTALGLVLAAGAFGAIGVLLGALAREARSATLVAFLCALPIVLIGLVPTGSVPAAGWISEAFPFSHAVDFFSAALSDADPAAGAASAAGWLVGLGLGYAALARLFVPRLLA
jgi:ABC-2 type transport system permease protein